MDTPDSKAWLSAKRVFLLLTAMAAAWTVHAEMQIQMSGGKGQVLDTATRLPVAGATVALECRRQLLHGSAKIRDVTSVSDKAGVYGFSLLDVAGCDFAYVRVHKPGYVDSGSVHTGYAYTNYGQIPKYRYLTAEADVVMLRLTAITPARTGTMFRMDGSPAHAAEYRAWYEAFFQAKEIATTDRERQFVRERYCGSLADLYAAMNDQEKADMAGASVSYYWRGVSRNGKHDYAGEVLPYCAR